MREAADADRIRRFARELGRSALQRVKELKETLGVNVELASPLDFLPALPDWEARSPFRFREGDLEVFDFDPYSQALSKLAREPVGGDPATACDVIRVRG